jgi:hypothetical protein
VTAPIKALAFAESEQDEICLYDFVYLDQAGQFHASGQHLLPGDEAAQAHAKRLLAGATLVVVYRDGRKLALLANLC